MNRFGVVLTGLTGVFKKERFFDAKASEKERTFHITGGPGCDPKCYGSKVTGTWPDGVPDIIDSDSLETVEKNGKRVRQIVTGDPPPDPTPIVEPQEPEAQKPVRRKR